MPVPQRLARYVHRYTDHPMSMYSQQKSQTCAPNLLDFKDELDRKANHNPHVCRCLDAKGQECWAIVKGLDTLYSTVSPVKLRKALLCWAIELRLTGEEPRGTLSRQEYNRLNDETL